MAVHPRRIAMKLAAAAVSACAVALLASQGARASIPGNADQKANEGLLHVCRDVEPANPNYLVCDEQVDPNDPASDYTASECTAAGISASCKLDLIPQLFVNGNLTLIADELPLDGDGNSSGTPQATLILTLTLGVQNITFVESFEGTTIGNWNPFFETDLTTGDPFPFVDNGTFQFSNGNLVELGLKIREHAQGFTDIDLSDSVPLLVNVVSNWNKVPVDGTSTGLGSAGFYKVQLRFVRVRP
jgi:hypothetical protein